MLRARNSVPKLFFALAALLLVGAYVFRFRGSPALDLYVHDTYYVISHNIFLLFLTLYLGACGVVYYVYPRIVHKQPSLLLAHLHFWISLGFIVLVFFSYRRVITQGIDAARPAHSLMSAFAVSLLGMLGFVAAQIIFVVNLIWSFFRAETNQTAVRRF